MNTHQAFALHTLLKPEIKLVLIYGVATRVRSFLALSGAFGTARRYFTQIYLVRGPIILLGNRDIGYLSGDIKSKIDPYMQFLCDNLKFI
ncbi:MAG: PhoH family protein [Flavobacteriales bacterium]